MTKKMIKLLMGIVLLLGTGITAGVLIGISIGEQNIYKELMETSEEEGKSMSTVTMGAEATKKPTVTLTQKATVTPTQKPTVTPTKKATVTPTQKATVTPTQKATVTPTKKPTVTPTKKATVTPTQKPTVTPTQKPTKQPAATGENGYYGRLHVEETSLVNVENQLVQLRGISTHGIGWFPQYVNEAAIRQFHEEWGCNVFRIAMYTAEGAGYCTGDAMRKEKLKEIVYTGIDAAIKQNMYVIVDWHVLQEQNPNIYKEEARAFFAEVAGKYGDDPHILYEICNEPNGGTSWSQIKSYALEVISVIRKYAPNAVIIVGTPTWSQDVDIAAKDAITEYDNIMYALHFYADTHRDSLRNKCKTAVEEGLPVFVTEYGICDASGNGAINETEANRWISMLDSYGISYVAWNLSNKNESSSMLAAGCSKTSGFTEQDLSAGGRWFVAMLQKAGGGSGVALSGTTEAGQEENGGSDGNTTGSLETESVSEDGVIGGGSENTFVEKQVDTAYMETYLTAGEGVSYVVSNYWSMGNSVGVQLALMVTNDTAAEETDWKRLLTVKEGTAIEVEKNWNSTVIKEENVIVITPAEYNRTIAAGASVGDIGIILILSE